MKPLLLFLLLSTAAWGQDKKTIVSVGYSRYQASDSDMKDIIYDTIPVSLLVRIQGRPWAFFHDGWEVRRWRMNDFRYLGGEHVGYLDSRKRPIRKEWVIYQTFKR